MKSSILALILAAIVLPSTLPAQVSDFAVKQSFEQRYGAIKDRIDSASTLSGLDSVKTQIDALEIDFSGRAAFLDKALFPQSFAGEIKDLRLMHVLTYDRVYLIQTQGVHISELEGRIMLLSGRLDSLTVQRDQLFNDLQESRKSVDALRETVRRLSANIQAKDKLIFALVDSIFLPYDKNLNQVADVQKQAISGKLERAEVVRRINEIAADNVKFLNVTQLQAKDYANLLDQYQQFNGRWQGLREKIIAVSPAGAGGSSMTATGKSSKGTAAKTDTTRHSAPGAQVDSTLADWHAKLMHDFWIALARQFTDKGLSLHPFADAKTFSLSVRAYVDTLKANKEDATVFVDDVWKQHIDRDWRDALSNESVLGKVEYASLDRYVSELAQEKIDQKFIAYAFVVLVIIIGAWWFLVRRPKGKQGSPPAPAAPAKP